MNIYSVYERYRKTLAVSAIIKSTVPSSPVLVRLLYSAMHKRLLITQRPIHGFMNSISNFAWSELISLSMFVAQLTRFCFAKHTHTHCHTTVAAVAADEGNARKQWRFYTSSSLAYTRVCSCNWMMETLSVAYRILSDTMNSEGCKLRCSWRKKKIITDSIGRQFQSMGLCAVTLCQSPFLGFYSLYIRASAFCRLIAIFLLNFGSFRPSLSLSFHLYISISLLSFRDTLFCF